MLSIRIPGAQNLNLGPEVQFRNRKYCQKCPKCREIYFYPKKCVRKVVVKPEVVVYFGLRLVKSEFGSLSQRNGSPSYFYFVWPLEPPGRSFLPHSGLYCRGIAHRRLEMLSESTIQKPEVRSKVPEMVRKVVKLSVIRKTLWSNLKWIFKTGSSCVLWPTFDVNTVKLGNGTR